MSPEYRRGYRQPRPLRLSQCRFPVRDRSSCDPTRPPSPRTAQGFTSTPSFSTRSSSTSQRGYLADLIGQRHGYAGRWRALFIGCPTPHPAGRRSRPQSRSPAPPHRPPSRIATSPPRHAQRTRITAGPRVLHHLGRRPSVRGRDSTAKSNADWPTTNSPEYRYDVTITKPTTVRHWRHPTWAWTTARACADCTPG